MTKYARIKLSASFVVVRYPHRFHDNVIVAEELVKDCVMQVDQHSNDFWDAQWTDDEDTIDIGLMRPDI